MVTFLLLFITPDPTAVISVALRNSFRHIRDPYSIVLHSTFSYPTQYLFPLSSETSKSTFQLLQAQDKPRQILPVHPLAVYLLTKP